MALLPWEFWNSSELKQILFHTFLPPLETLQIIFSQGIWTLRNNIPYSGSFLVSRNQEKKKENWNDNRRIKVVLDSKFQPCNNGNNNNIRNAGLI